MPLVAECVYNRSWAAPDPLNPASPPPLPVKRSTADDAKLIFGTVFSLRHMVRKLGGDDDAFVSFRTGQYKLHYYETPANLRFVMLTDTQQPSMRNVLHQIFINLWVEYGTWSRHEKKTKTKHKRSRHVLTDVRHSGQESDCASGAQGRSRSQERAV